MSIKQLKQAIYLTVELDKLAKQLHHSYENECNYGLTKRQESNQRRLQMRVEVIAERHGFTVAFCGDPRGPSFALYRGKTVDYYALGNEGQEWVSYPTR